MTLGPRPSGRGLDDTQFVTFIRKRDGRWIHPQDMGDAEVEAFLTHLAVERKSAASTQYQAMNGLVFLYREVIKKELGQVPKIRAKRPARLPTVLSREEFVGWALPTAMDLAVEWRSAVPTLQNFKTRS